MAFVATNSTKEARSFSLGPLKLQILTFTAVSGDTSGTVTADGLTRLKHVFVPSTIKHTAAPTFSGNVATLAFTCAAETAATRTIDGIAYTAVLGKGAGGNSITIREVDGTGDTPAVTNGTEVVTVSGNAITVRIDPTAVTGSTRTNVRAAVNASVAAAALVSATGTDATIASVTSATALTGGVTGGARGTCLCFGT